MRPALLGMHHVTAISADIGLNLRFWTRTLGLRLVKRSVNQDDTSAYHLFYADAVGSPGTDMTFFDWPQAGPSRPGPGAVATTEFRVDSATSVDFWADRLAEAGTPSLRADDELGRARLAFQDPEGLPLAIVAAGDAPGGSEPWTVVPPEHAVRGILGVRLASMRPDGTREMLRRLGFVQAEQASGERWRLASEVGAAEVVLAPADGAERGHPGAGGVHHVAFRVEGEAELLAYDELLRAAGVGTSGIVDRYYFKSLYFREPGGVLFELATSGPGFAVDEPLAELGARLALPPFLEGRRREIEARLKPLPELVGAADA